VLSHACGAAFDNPDLIVAAVVGDGEAETGALATSWHINKFLHPIRDGAVLPVLHLNGYKINNPSQLSRISHEELESLFHGFGWTPYFVEGSEPESMHQAMAATMEQCISEIRKSQQRARKKGVAERPRWPMIVLRSPKGWTAPEEVGGHKLEGIWRAHQVPMTDVKSNPKRLRMLETWMRGYKPEELFDRNGTLIPELKELAPIGARRMGARCLRSENYVNVIVCDKPLHLQYLSMDAAITHCTKGIGRWDPACNDQGVEPDVVMASAGDIPTQETLAAIVLPFETKAAQRDAVALLKQYGCGPIQFAGADGLYERHLLFDNVKDLDAIRAREQYEAFARSVRDVLSQRWLLTEKTYERETPKRPLPLHGAKQDRCALFAGARAGCRVGKRRTGRACCVLR
jgi:phosphoketolase